MPMQAAPRRACTQPAWGCPKQEATRAREGGEGQAPAPAAPAPAAPAPEADAPPAFRYGFHTHPSMRQLHMHIISTDLSAQRGPCNRFAAPFFVLLDEVEARLQGEGRLFKPGTRCSVCGAVARTRAQLATHVMLACAQGRGTQAVGQ